MQETTTKRRREKYSKLICLGCRARRIRYKACQRCQQNGLDCVVDYTTLGRPAQKRNRMDYVVTEQQSIEPSDVLQPNRGFDDTTAEHVDDFLLSHPETHEDGIVNQQSRPSKSEIGEAMTSPCHLLAALLSRDKRFASSIGSQPQVSTSVLQVIDDRTAVLLDQRLVWHRLFYPDIPTLPALREEIKAMEAGQYEQPAAIFLLTLLYDLALDVPSTRLASYKQSQPAVRALLYHSGQQLIFSLARCRYTVLALALTFQYRPLALTSSQGAAAHALKAVPHIVMAKYVASDLGYSNAAARLKEALQDSSTSESDIKNLIYECLHWIGLNLAEDQLKGPFLQQQFHRDPTVHDCLEALQNAVLLNRMPSEILLAYTLLSTWTQAAANAKELADNWRSLDHLSSVIDNYNTFCTTQTEVLERLSDQQRTSSEMSQAVSQCAEVQRHLSKTLVTGVSLFFAVMCGAYAQTHNATIQAEQAVEVSDNIIDQLRSHTEADPTRPPHRRFLEEHGETRMDELEKVLTNFITAADTLSLNGILYIGPSRDMVTSMLLVCKDIVEGNAARLKGWGGLHDRIDVQMILFHECARRLEAMSSSAGTEEALAKGCVLTACAKLIRSLHRILQGFKKSLAMSQRRSASESTRADPTPTSSTIGNVNALSDGLFSDDLFADWENWPQFDAFDFSDLFGSVFDGSASF